MSKMFGCLRGPKDLVLTSWFLRNTCQVNLACVTSGFWASQVGSWVFQERLQFQDLSSERCFYPHSRMIPGEVGRRRIYWRSHESLIIRFAVRSYAIFNSNSFRLTSAGSAYCICKRKVLVEKRFLGALETLGISPFVNRYTWYVKQAER